LNKIWYQTWLQFGTVEGPSKDTINLNVGEMDFREVQMKDRIVHLR
jgi:hypothetical protein